MTPERAGEIALAALAFIAGDAERLGRFLGLTGVGPADIRAQAQEATFQAAVLQHLMEDKSGLLMFAADRQLDPEDVVAAHRVLAGTDDHLVSV